MMKRVLIGLIAIAVVVPLAADDGPVAELAQQQIINFLALTGEQVEGWDLLLEVREEEATVIHEALEAVQAQLDELFALPDPDPTEVGELVLERRDLGEELSAVHRVYVEGFVEILDDDQDRKLAFIHRAEQAQRLFPAFRLYGFLPRD